MTAVALRTQLDLRGLKCPLPALRTDKALDSLAPGGEIEVIVTDPMAQIDIPHLVRTRGDHVVEQSQIMGPSGMVYTFVIARVSA